MYNNVSIFFSTPHLLKKGSFVDQYNVYNCYNIFTQHRKGMANGYLFIYLYIFSKHGVESDLTIPFFYQTNVLFIYIGAKKMDFLWAITRYCTMFTAHKKFEKDGSMRRICGDKQRQSKNRHYRLCFGCK